MYKQEAIMFTKNNAVLIASQLDFTTAQDLQDDYDYLFANSDWLVLVRDVMDDGMKLLSHVVTPSMFYANATAKRLTDTYFEPVTQL